MYNIMKKAIIAAIGAAILTTLVSCEKKENTVKTVSAVITIDESGLDADTARPESYTVVVSGNATSVKDTASTQNGMVTVSDLLPGAYTISVSAEVVDGGTDYIFSGETSANILSDGTEVSVKVSAVTASAFVLKEIYYNGCTIKEADETSEYADTYFRDQFYEIYNNSGEIAYADGLCLAYTTSCYANYDFSVIYTYDIPNADDYLFACRIWQIPGSGTDYPVKPGESIIVAQWATDHTDASLAGDKSINLAGAEFEALTEAKTLYSGLVLTDNAAINLNELCNGNKYSQYDYQWLVPVATGDIVLFKPSTAITNSDFLVATNYPSQVYLAKQFLKSDVLDAVQWYENQSDFDEPTRRFLPSSIDAGCNVMSSYTGKSLSRKVSYTRADGTVVYQDTNNTTNDFELNDRPQVRRNGAGKPSWNTWTN